MIPPLVVVVVTFRTTGERDDLPGGAEHRRVDELAAGERSRACRLEPLDGRLGARDLVVGRQVGLLDHGQLVGMDRGAAEVAELAAARARTGEPVQVAHVRVDRLRRPRQAGGDGRVDDPAARPVEPRLERARLGAEVGLAERDSRDPARRGDRVRGLEPGRRLDQAVDRVRRRRHVLGPGDLRDDDPADLQHRHRLQVGCVARVDADVDRLAAPLREQRGEAVASLRLRAGRDAVLEVDDHRVGARGDRLLDPIRPVGRYVEPGQRRDGVIRRGRPGASRARPP